MCTVSWAIVLVSNFFQFSFEMLFWGGFLVGLWRVGLLLPECRFLAQPLGGEMRVKEEYKGSLKIGSG